MAVLTLKPGREKSLLRRHPWIFSGAVERIEGTAQLGDTLEIRSAKGEWLAWAAYSPHSQIVARVWSFLESETISPDFFARRLEKAIQARTYLPSSLKTNACRLVYAESDFLPGIIIDRYGEFLVCQFLTAGAEHWKHALVEQLATVFPCKGIYERSDVDVRKKEGLEISTGVLYGEAPPEMIEIEERENRFLVNVCQGHKTGFYLDQRENRMRVAEYARGKEVLNCFAYTGSFGIHALRQGARQVTNVDTSCDALALARRHVESNGFDSRDCECIEDDVFKVLRRFRDSRRQFDLIILDPPKFAETRSQLQGASRGYKDINLLALKLLRPGGFLATFSCSGLVSQDLFQKIVADAALDARRDGQIVCRLHQSGDHPVALQFPEGSYLKGLICQVW